MTAAATGSPFDGCTFDNTFFRDVPGLCEPWQAHEVTSPRLLMLNEPLAASLGLDTAALATPGGVRALIGAPAPAGAEPVAQCYAGHQFGSYNPRLGDGRALLLGELIDPSGRRWDLHLKGSGRTPFARGGDGKAAVGPMLREYVVSEALHALGIPTTRSLAVVATGETIAREQPLPGAVLHRVASSHLRVGTFEYATRTGDRELLRALAHHAIRRHYPQCSAAANPYLAFFEAVVEAQASLIAQWMLVGFIHGVMNTDNMLVSGESIDFGPCAFMDAYDPGTVYSSIDHGGRYAYGNQPLIAHWNLARLGESLLALQGDDWEAAAGPASAVLQSFPERYQGHLQQGMARKLGFVGASSVTEELSSSLIEMMSEHRADHTGTFRDLARALRNLPLRGSSLTWSSGFADWLHRWNEALSTAGRNAAEAAESMDRVNPVYVPRNHLVDEALTAATAGDLAPFRALLDAVSRPYDERRGLERYAEPAPAEFSRGFRTFCGT